MSNCQTVHRCFFPKNNQVEVRAMLGLTFRYVRSPIGGNISYFMHTCTAESGVFGASRPTRKSIPNSDTIDVLSFLRSLRPDSIRRPWMESEKNSVFRPISGERPDVEADWLICRCDGTRRKRRPSFALSSPPRTLEASDARRGELG